MTSRRVVAASLGLALVLAGVGDAAAQTDDAAALLRKYDKNRNGSLEGEEWKGVPEQLRDNLRREVDVFKPVPLASIAELIRRRAVRTFESVDRDRDGRISAEEWERSRSTRETFQKGGVELSEELDSQQFSSYYIRSYVGLTDLTKPIVADRAERVTRHLPETYLPYDLDLDNQIGLYEWPRDLLLEFLMLDANGDGFLTPRELHAQTAPAEPTPPSPTSPSPASGR